MIGVLHIGSLTPRRFTGHEVELAAGRAPGRGGRAVHDPPGRPPGGDRAAAQPGAYYALPVVAGAELAARYVPGSGGVGGDWYDVFTLPTGELCVVIGDVAGSGLPAAVIMGRMRSALRAYALRHRDPAEVLRRLDRKMHHFEADAMATVLYAVIDPGSTGWTSCLAGHFPPVIANPPARGTGQRPSRPDHRHRRSGAAARNQPADPPRRAALLLHRRVDRASR